MNNSILEIQKKQYGFMHEYHNERTADILEVLHAKLGDGVIDTVEKSDVDRYSLYRWHLERTINMLN